MKVRAEKLADAIKEIRGTNGNLGEVRFPKTFNSANFRLF
jgi:hypothetical protein